MPGSAATIAAVCARWGDQGALELMAVISVSLMNATVRAMDHQPGPDARRLSPRAESGRGA